MSKFDKVAELARKNNPEWVKTELYDILFEYFSNSPDFEKRGYSLKKGLLLMGGVGCGKTTAINIFQELTRNTNMVFSMINCRHIVRDFRKKGEDVIDKYGRDSCKSIYYYESKPDEFPSALYIDDLGHGEVVSKQWGNESNVIADILLDRYENFQRVGQKTHGSTNLDADGFEKIYGARTRDRMREMMNLIIVKGESFRK